MTYLSVSRSYAGFAFQGELDCVTAGQIDDLPRHRDGGSLLIDLGGVNFIDSSGMAGLLRLQRNLAEHGTRLVLTSVTANTLRLFELTGLDQVFTMIR